MDIHQLRSWILELYDPLERQRQYVIFDAERVPFDRVQLVVDGRLRYEELMKVVDVCTKQVLADGKPLNRLSFIDMPNPGGT